MPTTIRRRLFGRGTIWAVASLLSLALAGCNPHFGTTNGPVQHTTINTRDGEVYEYALDGDTLVAAAPETNEFGNVREFFWSEENPYVADQQSCTTLVYPAGNQGGDIIQTGLALRIAPSGPDGQGVKGVTVHQNIWSAALWIFWVNIWDTTWPAVPYQAHQSFDVSGVVGKFWIENDEFHSTLKSGPWHLCARTRGLDVTFKIWTGTDPEPSWDDPVHVFSTTLPEGWDHPGYSGGYVGHVKGGEAARFTGFSTVPLCLLPDQIDTAYCQAQFDALQDPPPGPTTP